MDGPMQSKPAAAAAAQDALNEQRKAQLDEEREVHAQNRLAFRVGETPEERAKRLNIAEPVDDLAPQ